MSTLFSKRAKRQRRNASHNDDDAANRPRNADLSITAGKTTPSADASAHQSSTTSSTQTKTSALLTFQDLGLAEPLVATCKQLGFKRPTPVQRTIIPFLLRESSSHVLALASTGSGKTAAFCLPILQRLSRDPYGIYAVVLTPTRELAKQIHQQVLALGKSAYGVTSTLVVGGLDAVKQSCELHQQRPHFCIATPGRLAELLRGPCPPRLQHVRYVVLDEADRLLTRNSGFERDVAELLLHTQQQRSGKKKKNKCQTLLFSATMTRSLESVEEIAGAGQGRLPLKKFVIRQDGEDDSVKKKKKKRKLSDDGSGADGSGSDNDNVKGNDSDEDGVDDDDTTTPRIPAGLKQEYIFMPSRVRDAYLITTVRHLMANGGRHGGENVERNGSGWTATTHNNSLDDDEEDPASSNKARSAIIFVSTCERAALISSLLTELGVQNVALHSLLSQNRRLAALGKFQSQHVRLLVATDVASRGLDIPTVDLVINSELPRTAVSYVHRVGRTARAGRRGRAVSLVSETEIGLVHAAERISGRQLELCKDVTDDMAIRLLPSTTKASRLAKQKLMDIGFFELAQKTKERKLLDRKERERIERALRRSEKRKKKRDKKQEQSNK